MRWAPSVIAAEKLGHPSARGCSARAHAPSFGRKVTAVEEPRRPLLSSDDVRLFLTTFAAGFIFVGVLIA
jgi:hypothetical protein